MKYMKKAQEAWNDRLKRCRENYHLSQEELAEALNNHYRTETEKESFQQRSISRWERVGQREKKKKGEQKDIGFPKVETMIRLAHFFEKDVGYFLGETDIESDSLKGASDYIGLDQETVQAIRRYTHRRSCFVTVGLDKDEARMVLAYLFSSHSFQEILHLLYNLIEYNRNTKALAQRWADAEKEFGAELFDDALAHYDEYDWDTPAPSPEFARAARAIKGLIDEGNEDEGKREIANSIFRYRLGQMFSQLLDEIVQQDAEVQKA